MQRPGGLMKGSAGERLKPGSPSGGIEERREKMARRRQLGFGGFPNFVEVRLQGLGRSGRLFRKSSVRSKLSANESPPAKNQMAMMTSTLARPG